MVKRLAHNEDLNKLIEPQSIYLNPRLNSRFYLEGSLNSKIVNNSEFKEPSNNKIDRGISKLFEKDNIKDLFDSDKPELE